MKKLNTYIDCGSGIAGDMLIGSLIELGLSLEELNRTLHRAIPLNGWKIVATRTERHMWPARRVVVEGDRHFGSAPKMIKTIRASPLPKPVKNTAIEILNRLVVAERRAHGGHSIGEFDDKGLALLDTLVDVLGTAWGFWRLGINEVKASPVNTGRMAPASAQILKEYKIPAFSTQAQYELATPTGVAILSVMAKEFGPMPIMNLQSAGYGAGQKDIPGKPNVLAIYQGSSTTTSGMATEPVLVLETVMDDMDPRLYPHVSDLLMKNGALDAWWISAGMKKGRPGIAYSVLCRPQDEKRLVKILFSETTTLGIRRLPLDRWTLSRREGGMRKIAELPLGGTKSQVEYEVARKKAVSLSMPLRKLLK